MRTVKVAAVMAGAAWATVKLAQWVMVQALRLAALGLVLWFVAGVVKHLAQ